MFAEMLHRLAGAHEKAPLSAADSHLALAALMVRLARSDNSYTARERARIDKLLAELYGLGAAAAGGLRADAEAAEEAAPDTVQFTRQIKQAVPYEARERVIEALWRVATADGIVADERGMLRLVANLLGVSDRDSGLARQRAERAD